MSLLEDFQALLKTVKKWGEEYVRHEAINHAIMLLIPSSLLPALIQWVVNPTKSFLALALVTAPFTITVALMVIIVITFKEIRRSFLYLSIMALFLFYILWVLTGAVNLAGLGTTMEMHTHYWNPITNLINATEKSIPQPFLSFVRMLSALLVPFALLYDMLGSYVAMYRWSLLMAPVVGVISGWICLLILNFSYLNALFIKIKEGDKAYPYDRLKKIGRLTDDIGGLTITFTFDEKSGIVSVKDAGGNDIPFDLAKRKDLSPETEIYAAK